MLYIFRSTYTDHKDAIVQLHGLEKMTVIKGSEEWNLTKGDVSEPFQYLNDEHGVFVIRFKTKNGTLKGEPLYVSGIGKAWRGHVRGTMYYMIDQDYKL